MESGRPATFDDGIRSRLKGSDQEILQIRVVTALASLRWIRQSRNPPMLAAIIIGCVPLLGAVAESIGGGGVGWFVWTTAIVYGFLVALMLYSAVHFWNRVIELGAAIDSILDGHGRVTVSRSLGRALGLLPQAAVFAFGLAFSTWVGFQLTEPLGHYAGNAGLAYRLTIGWTGGFGALTVYWLWGAPAILAPLTRIEHPRLDWVAPLQTPAVQQASRLLIDGSRLAAAGLLLFTIPIAMTLALASRHWAVWVLSVSCLVFSLVTVLVCSLLPQIALENLVRRGRAYTLKRVRLSLPKLEDLLEAPTPEAVAPVEIYERLAQAPVTVVDWKRFAEACLLLLSSAVPITIALLSS